MNAEQLQEVREQIQAQDRAIKQLQEQLKRLSEKKHPSQVIQAPTTVTIPDPETHYGLRKGVTRNDDDAHLIERTNASSKFLRHSQQPLTFVGPEPMGLESLSKAMKPRAKLVSHEDIQRCRIEDQPHRCTPFRHRVRTFPSLLGNRSSIKVTGCNVLHIGQSIERVLRERKQNRSIQIVIQARVRQAENPAGAGIRRSNRLPEMETIERCRMILRREVL